MLRRFLWDFCEMGSEEFGSQQTSLSRFFRNVHSKFTGLAKQELKVDAASKVVRKKQLLVIGDFTDNVTSEDPICAPEIRSVSEVDSKDGIAIIQVAQTDSILAKAISEGTVAEARQANAGARVKRKATEFEDAITKRIDARIHEAPFPSTKSAIKKEPEEETTTAKASAKRVTWEQDSDWIHESSAPESRKEAGPVKDVIVQQNRYRVQAPPCNEFSNSADENDGEICSTSGRRTRKDMFSGETWGLPVDLKGDLFCSKLKEILCKPFDAKESSEMWDLVTRRKPVLKLRQTRGRTMHVPSQDEGLSYLDHHPDFAQRIKESSHPAVKLALLRAFFFWLQHSCMEGAFKPWAPEETKSFAPEGDCVLTDGPDCEVLAVVLPLDEKNEVSTVMKPLEPLVIDLSDDDEDDCSEVIVKPPVKTARKTDGLEKLQNQATCICCKKKFGMEKERQRALYRSCCHINTCMQCVERLWKLEKHACLKCGAIQSTKPGSLLEFIEA